jgi:hypothetical protein
MTGELQRAMARYEAARGNYRIAVLGSLRMPGRGEAIRAAIEDCQAARAALRRLTSRPNEADRYRPAAAPVSTRSRRMGPVFATVAGLLSLKRPAAGSHGDTTDRKVNAFAFGGLAGHLDP